MDIDRKFNFTAFHAIKGTYYSNKNGVVFLAKDPALPAALAAYRARCEELCAGTDQIKGILLLEERVALFQKQYPRLVKVADIDPGPEADVVLAPTPATCEG